MITPTKGSKWLAKTFVGTAHSDKMVLEYVEPMFIWDHEGTGYPGYVVKSPDGRLSVFARALFEERLVPYQATTNRDMYR